MQQGFQVYGVDEMEYGFLTVKTKHSSGSFKLHVPKLMTFARSAPKTETKVFNNNIFVNDTKCKPASDKKIVTQNFLTVKRFFDCDFKNGVDKFDNLAEGRRFVLQLMNRNIKDMYVHKIT